MFAFRSTQKTALLLFLISAALTQDQLGESDDKDDPDYNDYHYYDYPSDDDSQRFCNGTATRLIPGDCTWPCTNTSSCAEGSVLDSFEDCELESWQKALQAGSFNVSSEEGNSSTSAEDDVFDPASLQACRAVCAEDIEDPQCCPGFFGPSCSWCPHNGSVICSGHGTCNDGIEGDGACQCFENFTGIFCEVCKDGNMYGPNCAEECLCVNGLCDNGPSGSGNCTLCYDGFQGPLCDEEIITCHDLTCPNNSLCEEVDGQSKCVCLSGYQGDPTNDLPCTPINLCESAKRVCGSKECVYLGPGKFECRCPEGHETTPLKTCIPINPCLQHNGGCDLDTTMCVHTGPNVSKCDCLAFYENYVPGKGCSLVDVCPTATCHADANCTTTGPNEHKCTCLPGYVGDGEQNCFGSIYERLSELNRQDPSLRGQLSMSLGLIDRLYRTAMTEHGPFTIFIPNNRAFKRARKDFTYAEMLTQPQKTRQVLRQHILLGKMTLEELQAFDHYYTLDGSIADLQVRVARDIFKYKIRGFSNKAKVIARNRPASNGIIHVVNELLINEPTIVGDATKTAMELIEEEGRFNRLQTLINSLGVRHVFEQDNITVFAPENGGLDNLPEGTLDYLTTDEEGKVKLRKLLENHIFPGRMRVTDLVNKQRIHSVANYAFDVSVTDMGRVQLMGKVNISQADIPCKNAVYYHIDGPLIPEELADILPSRCDMIKNTTIKGRCTLCDKDMHCPLKSDNFYGEVAEGCSFWGTREGSVTKIPGCQPVCVRTYTIARCCPGFYGRDCQPCPGGHKNPCNGHGECSDERFGSGFCLCDRNFRGEKCELCMDRMKYGPNCTEPCSCMHGTCDGGPTGSGKCVPGTCFADFRGENCELEQKYCRRGKKLQCHLHAECVVEDSTYRCACVRGYEGDGTVCTEIDPCQKPDRGGCHTQASCTKIGPGANQCECDEGWYGDGFDCRPVNPCNSTDQCHDNAKCVDIRPGMFTCRCLDGYEGNGTDCTEVDACLENNGGCHSLATCTATGPGQANCTCPDNLVGDGQYCYTTIASAILGHENLTLLAGLMEKIPPEDTDLDDMVTKFTFFAPSDEAIRRFLSDKVPGGKIDDEEVILSFFEFHSLWHNDFTIDQMLIRGNNGSTRFDTAFTGFTIRVIRDNETARVLKSQTESVQVVQPDILTDNGVLHIIDDVLAPILPPEDPPFIREFFQQNPQYSVFNEWLEKKNTINNLMLPLSDYTLFVPTNEAFEREQLNQTITVDYLDYHILDDQLLIQSIDNDLDVPTIVDKQMLRFTTNGSEVYVNGVKIVRGNLFTDGGVIHVIDGLLRPVLNFCNRRTDTTEFGPCGECNDLRALTCAPGFKPVVSMYGPPVRRHRCFLNITDAWNKVHKFPGCQRLCEKHVEIQQCCAGHYGPDCLECPGGPETPCSGQGICDEGIGGTGHCVCDRLHTGINCQQCLDPTMAGPGCNISKTSCDYQNGNCSVNALCVPYQTNDGSPGVHCRCNPGYVGDGYTCTSPCDTQNGGCHANAVCSIQPQDSDKAVKCTCKEGYHGNGVSCVENRDRCEDDNGGCSAYADCRYSPPPVTSEREGDITCACLPGYVGNGTLCVTTVLNALSQIPDAFKLHQTLRFSVGYDNLTQLLGSHQSAVTIFVPIGASGKNMNINDYVLREGITLSDELVVEANTSATGLYSVSGLHLPLVKHEGQYYIRGARVLDSNIPALNGYVNLLASPFDEEGLNIGKSTKSDGVPVMLIVIIVAVLLLLIIVVVVGVVCYNRSRASGFLDIVKRFRKGSDASMSFARLKAQESSEENVHSPFAQPDNVNFDNPLYNDPDSS